MTGGEDSGPVELPVARIHASDLESRLLIVEHKIRDMQAAARRVGRVGQWIVSLAFVVLSGLGGLAYDAHLTLANRMIQVTRLMEAQLARVEERLEAQRQLLSLLMETRK